MVSAARGRESRDNVLLELSGGLVAGAQTGMGGWTAVATSLRGRNHADPSSLFLTSSCAS